MPKSRFVSARRLLPLLVYCAAAFVVLLAADGLWDAMGWGGRPMLVPAWMVLFPAGGILIWRRSQ